MDGRKQFLESCGVREGKKDRQELVRERMKNGGGKISMGVEPIFWPAPAYDAVLLPLLIVPKIVFQHLQYCNC